MSAFLNFSELIQRDRLKRHGLFAILALLTVGLAGYHYGTFDQVFHIPFLKVWMDPSLYPSDPFVGLKDYHFSYFWFMFQPFAKAGILEPALFITHLLVTYATFWMFWELSDLLFNNALANLLLTFALVVPHLGFPGFQIIEFSLLNRTFAIPFLLGVLVLYLKRKYVLAALLLGLVFDIHLVYALFVVAMIGMDQLYRFKRIRWSTLLLAVIVFLIAISPLLLRKSEVRPGFDFSVNWELEYLEAYSTLYTVYFPVGPIPYVLLTFTQGLACAAIILITMRKPPTKPYDERVRHFLVGIAVVIAIGSLAAYLLPVTVIIQLQLIRIGVFLLYLAYIYFGYLTARTIQTENLSDLAKIVLVITYITMALPLLSLLFWLARKGFSSASAARFGAALALLIIIAQIYIAGVSKLFSPGFHIYGEQDTWRETQEWAKANTPKDAFFITPPYQFWHYIADWRVFSERGTLATIPEFMVLHLNPDYVPGFVERYNDLAPGVIENLTGDYYDTFAFSRQAFDAHDQADFEALAKKYDADYLVVPAVKDFELPIAYQNSDFTVYQFPAN